MSRKQIESPQGRDQEAGKWVGFVTPLLHPQALSRCAEQLDLHVAALQAVLEGTAFVDRDDVLRQWPWYPEEEEPDGLPGLERPRHLLDEPFEAAVYLQRTGRAVLEAFLQRQGVELERVSGIRLQARPAVSGDLGEVPHRDTLALDRFRVAREEAEYRSEEATARHQQDIFEAWCGEGSPRRRLDERVEAELPEDLYTDDTLNAVWMNGDVVYLKTGEALYGAGRRHECPGTLVWMKGHLAVVDVEYGLRVFDLNTGGLRGGTWGELLAEVDATDAFLADERFREMGHSDVSGRFSLGWRGISRLVDSEVVADHPRWEFYDAEDPPLMITPDPDVSVQTVEVDGVRFFLGGTAYPIDRSWERSFALGPRGWRCLAGRSFMEGDEEVARFDGPVVMGALDADGTRAVVVDGSRVHVLSWDDEPMLERSTPLEELFR